MDLSRVLPPVLIEVRENLTLETKPVKIIDWSEKMLRNKRVPLVRVLWRNSQKKKDVGKGIRD